MKQTVSIENSVEENMQIVCRLKTLSKRLSEELKWKWIKDLWRPYYDNVFIGNSMINFSSDPSMFFPRKKSVTLPVYEKPIGEEKEPVRLWGCVHITIPLESHFGGYL